MGFDQFRNQNCEIQDNGFASIVMGFDKLKVTCANIVYPCFRNQKCEIQDNGFALCKWILFSSTRFRRVFVYFRSRILEIWDKLASLSGNCVILLNSEVDVTKFEILVALSLVEFVFYSPTVSINLIN